MKNDLSVLIVEDESLVALDVKNRLETLGYHVAGHVRSGEEALVALETVHVQLILMDIRLRGDLDGIQTAERIREKYDIPIIFLSAYSDNNTIERVKLVDSFGYLLKPLKDRDIAIAIDMALSKYQLRKELNNGHILMQTTLNNISEGVITYDITGTIQLANLYAQTLLGYSNEELKNRQIKEIFYSDEEKDGKTAWKAKQHNGLFIPIEYRNNVIRESDGSPSGFVSVFRDMSEQINIKRNMQLAVENAEQMDLARNEFFANMSHELRTPLNSIIGMADLALDLSNSVEQKEFLDILKQSSNTLLSLINSILDFSKIEAGKMKVHSDPFNLHELLERIVENLAIQAHQKEINLFLDIHPSISKFFRGDYQKIEQILLNLLSNAIKFTDKGHVLLEVEYVDQDTSANDLSIICFAVKDTGVGIPQEFLSNIFNPFIQADSSSTRKHGGTGLGLAISQRLVRLLDGEIAVESEKGKGTTFTVTVPLEVDFSLSETESPERVFQDFEGNLYVLCSTGILENIIKTILLSQNFQAFTLNKIELSNIDFHSADILITDIPEAIEILTDRNIYPGLVLLKYFGSGNPKYPAHHQFLHSYLSVPIRSANLFQAITFHDSSDSSGPDEIILLGDRRQKNFRLLLVEDDQINRLVNSRLLEKAGYRVSTAVDGKDALDRAEVVQPQAIIMDLEMPIMNGYEATRAIRHGMVKNIDPEIPIIALTASVRTEQNTDARMFNQTLLKPFDPKNLMEMVDSLLLGNNVEDEKTGVKSHLEEILILATEALEQNDFQDLIIALKYDRKKVGTNEKEEINTLLFRLLLAARKGDKELVLTIISDIKDEISYCK